MKSKVVFNVLIYTTMTVQDVIFYDWKTCIDKIHEKSVLLHGWTWQKSSKKSFFIRQHFNYRNGSEKIHPKKIFFFRDGLDILLPKVARCISRLAAFAEEFKDLPTLGNQNKTFFHKISWIFRIYSVCWTCPIVITFTHILNIFLHTSRLPS